MSDATLCSEAVATVKDVLHRDLLLEVHWKVGPNGKWCNSCQLKGRILHVVDNLTSSVANGRLSPFYQHIARVCAVAAATNDDKAAAMTLRFLWYDTLCRGCGCRSCGCRRNGDKKVVVLTFFGNHEIARKRYLPRTVSNTRREHSPGT